MPARESNDSPVYNEDGSADRTFNIWDVTDGQQALGMAFAAASPTWEGRFRNVRPKMEPNEGNSTWIATFRYEPGEQVLVDPIEDERPVLDFDTTGGTLHLTQCNQQRGYSPTENVSEIESSRVIGANGESVDGVDVPAPKLTFSVNRIPPIIHGEYIKNLARYVGRANAAPYYIYGLVLGVEVVIPFEAGELMFLGAVPADRRFSYKFEASENRYQYYVSADIFIDGKRGFEYQWVRYKSKQLTKPSCVIPVPQAVFIAEMFPPVPFFDLLGF